MSPKERLRNRSFTDDEASKPKLGLRLSKSTEIEERMRERKRQSNDSWTSPVLPALVIDFVPEAGS